MPLLLTAMCAGGADLKQRQQAPRVLGWLRGLGGVWHKSRERAPIEDQLRERWLRAINELGVDDALREAAEAFALRFGCDLNEGRAIALRAWRMLSLPGAPT